MRKQTMLAATLMLSLTTVPLGMAQRGPMGGGRNFSAPRMEGRSAQPPRSQMRSEQPRMQQGFASDRRDNRPPSRGFEAPRPPASSEMRRRDDFDRRGFAGRDFDSAPRGQERPSRYVPRPGFNAPRGDFRGHDGDRSWEARRGYDHGRDYEHRWSWAARGGYHGYFIPERHYHRYWGPDHWFRFGGLRVSYYYGAPRYFYSGYWISVVDPIPDYWGDSWYDDDVYVECYDGGYYLFNRRWPGRPGVAVAIFVR